MKVRLLNNAPWIVLGIVITLLTGVIDSLHYLEETIQTIAIAILFILAVVPLAYLFILPVELWQDKRRSRLLGIDQDCENARQFDISLRCIALLAFWGGFTRYLWIPLQYRPTFASLAGVVFGIVTIILFDELINALPNKSTTSD